MLVQLQADLEEELGPDAFLAPAEKYEPAQVATLTPVRALFEHLSIAPTKSG